jgi:TolA-binding protein
MKKGSEQRRSPRRKANLNFDLLVAGETIPAVITDLSLYGMGIFLRGKSDLDAEVLDLRIKDFDLNTSGKVVWKREMFSGVKIGVCRLGPLEGRLGVYRLSDLVFGILKAQKTGVLLIETKEWTRKVFFKDGEMVYSESNIGGEQLGSILLATGKISTGQYENSLSLARQTGKNQGAVLVEMRYLAPYELIQAVHQRAESIIMNLCNVGDAKFSFREEALPKGESLVLKLNASDLLYRGSRNIESVEVVRERYLHPEAHLALSTETDGILRRLNLEERDMQILKLMASHTSLRNILSNSPLSEEETLRTLYAMLNAGLIDIDTEVPGAEADNKQQTDQAVQALAPEVVERIERIYREHKSLGYYGVLGLRQNASAAEIKRGYHAMAREYHPDRYLHVQSDSLKKKLNEIFAYINEAYCQLSKPGGGQQRPGVAVREHESPENKSRDLAKTKYREGRDHLAAGNYEDAMTLLGQAVYLEESVPDYHYYYGIALLRNKKIRDAEASLRKALHRSPSNAAYMTELGHIYLKLGFKTRARTMFEKALNIDPSHDPASQGLRQAQEQ